MNIVKKLKKNNPKMDYLHTKQLKKLSPICGFTAKKNFDCSNPILVFIIFTGKYNIDNSISYYELCRLFTDTNESEIINNFKLFDQIITNLTFMKNTILNKRVMNFLKKLIDKGIKKTKYFHPRCGNIWTFKD